MSEQNKAVVRRMFDEYWTGKNRALADEFFAPTATLHTPDGVFTGVDGALGLLQAYETGFPDFRCAIEDLVAEGDKVVVRWTFTGTHQGSIAGIPPTGRQVSVPNGIVIHRLAGGKVVEAHFTWNKYALLEQLGALSVSSSAAA